MSEARGTSISSSKRHWDWRVDPDNRQDRKSGEVITYKLTPEGDALEISFVDGTMPLSDLNIFIAELQEIKKLVG